MFIELHCHSVFSLLDGASEPEALLARAKALGMPALALTDHDDLGGVVRFAQAARDLEIDGIIGAELTVSVDDNPTHLVLLAESREGYGNIASLITRARMDTSRGEPAVSLDTLARHARGIFALTGCPRGWVPSRFAAGDPDRLPLRCSTSSRAVWRSNAGTTTSPRSVLSSGSSSPSPARSASPGS
jgi:error-prone DNA polymerase